MIWKCTIGKNLPKSVFWAWSWPLKPENVENHFFALSSPDSESKGFFVLGFGKILLVGKVWLGF